MASHSRGPVTDEHLKKKVKNNLRRKVDIFVNRKEADRDKVFIFTDKRSLWRSTGPKNEGISIRTSIPMVPISKEYKKKRSYDVMREMNWYISKYTSTLEAEVDWQLYNSGTDKKPKVHLLFAQDHLDVAWRFLRVEPIHLSPTNKLLGKGHPDLSPITEEGSVPSSSSASAGPSAGPSHGASFESFATAPEDTV